MTPGDPKELRSNSGIPPGDEGAAAGGVEGAAAGGDDGAANDADEGLSGGALRAHLSQ
ncbi:MAG: hypothetical protein RJA70_4837, partial [Pseudomonadota bacterium]